MEEQKKKISEFLDGIIDKSLPAEQQIMLFSQEEGIEGAVTENSGCANKAAACGGTTNNKCKNYDSNCNNTKNTVCEALNFSKCGTTNGAACELKNFYVGCGGSV